VGRFLEVEMAVLHTHEWWTWFYLSLRIAAIINRQFMGTKVPTQSPSQATCLRLRFILGVLADELSAVAPRRGLRCSSVSFAVHPSLMPLRPHPFGMI
jgi:hypothetical protein